MADDLTAPQEAARQRLSSNLKRIRHEKGLSQERFADLSGLHRTHISQVERKVANVTLDTVALLADALEVDLAELFLHAPGESKNLKAGRPEKAAAESVAERRKRKSGS
jgi:transcriptional regulator with XRE-family HTH domain